MTESRFHAFMEGTLEFDDIQITYHDGLVETVFWRGLDILSRLTNCEIEALQEQVAYEMLCRTRTRRAQNLRARGEDCGQHHQGSQIA